MAEQDALTNTMMEYLTVMAKLDRDLHKIRVVDVAKELGVKKPSVCHAVQILKDHGCVTADGGRNIELTETGRKLGENRLAREGFFRAILREAGVGEEEERKNAFALAHAVSDEVYEKLSAYERRRSQND